MQPHIHSQLNNTYDVSNLDFNLDNQIQQLPSEEDISNINEIINPPNQYIASQQTSSSLSSTSTIVPPTSPLNSFLTNPKTQVLSDPVFPIIDCSISTHPPNQNDLQTLSLQPTQPLHSSNSFPQVEIIYQNPKVKPRIIPEGKELFRIQMPPQIQKTTTLATHTDTDMPRWAPNFQAMIKAPTRTEQIFRIPNASELTNKWAFTRPLPNEALTEDSFRKVAVESSTIFRIEDFDILPRTVEVTPTVSNHWLLLPCEYVDCYTMGLIYLDVKHQRPDEADRVPPLERGRFIIDNRNGEIFITGWRGDFMVVAWAQSILGCERTRELLMYKAPEQGCRPTQLRVRNTFFERRSCRFCANPSHSEIISKPCTVVDAKANSKSFTLEGAMLRNVATMYRRFRGSYFGVCVKSRYQNSQWIQETVCPVFVDIKHTLDAEKQALKARLLQHIDFSVRGCFGAHPAASGGLVYIFKAGKAAISNSVSVPKIEDTPQVTSTKRRGRGKVNHGNSPRTITNHPEQSTIRTRNRIDESKVTSEKEKRKIINNRRSAQRSNAIRKQKQLQTERDLKVFKSKVAQLQKKYEEVSKINQHLKQQVSDEVLSPPMIPFDDEFREDQVFL